MLKPPLSYEPGSPLYEAAVDGMKNPIKILRLNENFQKTVEFIKMSPQDIMTEQQK